MRVMLIFLAFLAATPVAAQDGALPGWLAGCWERIEGERWTDECWTRPRGGILIGSGRAGKGEMLRSWEAMQIIRGADGRMTFWASPNGAPRIGFPMVSQSATEIVFANPAHDYPQRIRYWRDGRRLKAETALADGSQAVRFTFEPDE